MFLALMAKQEKFTQNFSGLVKFQQAGRVTIRQASSVLISFIMLAGSPTNCKHSRNGQFFIHAMQKLFAVLPTRRSLGEVALKEYYTSSCKRRGLSNGAYSSIGDGGRNGVERFAGGAG